MRICVQVKVCLYQCTLISSCDGNHELCLSCWAVSLACFSLGQLPLCASKNTENKEAPFGIIQLSPFSFFRRAYPADTKLFNKHTPAWCYRGKNWLSPHRDDTRTTEAKGEEIYIYYWLYFLCVGNSTMKTPNVHLTPSLGVILLKFRGFQLVKL